MMSISYACQDDSVSTSTDIPLSFSLDTLRFDTVFTSLGSATRSFKIYNELEEAVILDKIQLRNTSGFFRLNIDGVSTPLAENVRIEALDSIYVFAEVTIDPDNPLSISPFIIDDLIDIQAKNSVYDIHLEAWGQNANYFPNRNANGQVNYISCNLDEWVWDDPRPYVIYGALVIDSCRVNIPAGQSVYVHGGIAINELGVYNDGLLIFLSNASLNTFGTADEPVRFLSDRLEEEFLDVSGQWGGIILNAGSRDNTLRHTKIRNSIVGVSVDSTSFLRMEECEIAYTSGSALACAHASVYAQNCLFYANGGNSVNLNYGGSYIFNHCTMANYDNQETAVSANNFRCSDAFCEGPIAVNGLFAEFNNCIIVGNDDDEISLSDISDGDQPNLFVYNFNECIIKVDDLLDPDAFPNFFDNCDNCLNSVNSDTLFVDRDNYDYHLDTLSIAIDKAQYIVPLNYDLESLPREINSPDIGCYEFQK
ncbi:MAG: hypothetical protein HKN09_05990 [Saprospiraceae bacterium]|nr:hypothetical protein [Saprospiraceae bacterium]